MEAGSYSTCTGHVQGYGVCCQPREKKDARTKPSPDSNEDPHCVPALITLHLRQNTRLGFMQPMASHPVPDTAILYAPLPRVVAVLYRTVQLCKTHEAMVR